MDDERTQRFARANVAQPAESVDEADAVRIETLGLSSPGHDQPHEIVGQSDHQQFFVDAGHGLAPQHVQMHGSLEVPQVDLHLPVVGIKLCRLRGGMRLGIQQRGDERHLAGVRSGGVTSCCPRRKRQLDRIADILCKGIYADVSG